jgi:hypothetical protein
LAKVAFAQVNRLIEPPPRPPFVSCSWPTLVRKVNADDKRQAAELIELDGGELRREPLDTRKATFGVAAKQS